MDEHPMVAVECDSYSSPEGPFPLASESGFHTHSFLVSLFKSQARLFRWDRAGAIVTESFDYVASPLLAEFFMRFDRLTPRGRDSTVKIPSKEDRLAASRLLAPMQRPDESDEEFEGRKKEFDPATFLEYLVPNPEAANAEPLRFIGLQPTRARLSLLGRSSRGCAVYDVQNKCVCYLKDTWRVDSSLLVQEGKTYEQLHEANVPHIARVVTHGDIVYENTELTTTNPPAACSESTSRMTRRGAILAKQIVPTVSQQRLDLRNVHKTTTDKFCQETWCTLKLSKQLLPGYTHYRLVSNVVGRDLTSFHSTKELIQVFIDTIEAHWQAYSNAQVLHRDISVGNLMITEDGRGFLIDWDLAMNVNSTGARMSGRTGTRQFISAGLLMYPGKLHRYADDLESFLHVLYYTLLCFSETNCDSEDLRCLVDELFNECYEGRRRNRSGGTVKAIELIRKTYIHEALQFSGRPRLRDHLDGIARMFQQIYSRGSAKSADKNEDELEAKLSEDGLEDEDEDDEIPRVDFFAYKINDPAAEELEKTGAKEFQRRLGRILKLSAKWFGVANVTLHAILES